jgi:segregation and condensation protein B
MSLKAKIEAVVYAAEEPVTLAQLAALFADEALEYQREHQPVLPLEGELPEQESLLDGDGVAGDAATGGDGEPLPVEDAESIEGAAVLTAVGKSEPVDGIPTEGGEAAGDGEAAAEVAAPAAAGTDEGAAEASADAAAFLRESPEAAEKRLARVRDREVKEVLRGQLDELIREYAQSDRGIEIRQIAGGYRIGTKPEYHDSVRSFVKSLKPPMKLSLQALETLAVIAYKQPVTAPEVSEIRGVDTSGVLGSLISRKLITTAGRKQVIGRPILYKTTKEFLLRFGLKDVNELPSIEEFEKMAGELAEADVQDDPHVAAPEELPFFEPGRGERAAEEVPEGREPMSQKRDMGHPDSLSVEASVTSDTVDSDYVTDTVSEAEGSEVSVTNTAANISESAAEEVGGDENGYPSEAQTVPGGAHKPTEDLKEDR